MGMTELTAETEVRRRSMLPVLFAGGVTTALTLIGNSVMVAVSDGEFDLMSMYANLIIPIGPLLVGLIAGCGYGLMSWLTGVKITGKLLWLVLFCQLIAYVVAQFLSILPIILYAQDAGLYGRGLGDVVKAFAHFFDEFTRSFEMVDQGKEATGVGMGTWGYGIRFLEILGFVGGGLIVPAITKTAPYCDRCKVYMKTKSLGLLPCGCPQRKVGKKDEAGQAAYAAEHEAGFLAAMEQLETIRKWAEEGQVSDLKRLIDPYQEKAARKETEQQTARLELKIQRCRNCHAGTLQAVVITGGGDTVSQEDLGKSPASPLLEGELG